jgi:pre-mRNA-splicing factor ATP-dependent RNA helicase DHX16
LLASTAKTPDSLFVSLNQGGLPDTPDAHGFINEVFNRVPRKSKHKHSEASAARRQAEKDAKALRTQQYGFLLEEEESVTVAKDKGKSKERSHREKPERHTRKRETDGKDWESDGEEQVRKRLKTDDSPREDEDLELPEDEDERREKERLRDLRERDAFAERVRQKDRDKTKKVVEDHSSKRSAGAAAEAAQRRQLADDAVSRVAAMPGLREHSRQEYLSKREIQQIELLRKEIEDDENLFRGMRISKREHRDLEYKKDVLRLAEERLKIDDKYDGYQLPEDYLTEQGKIDKKKKEGVLYQRYEEAREQAKEGQFVTDVDQWEASQTKHSTFKTGAMDKVEIVEDYDYVFDESQTIKFVMESTLHGESQMSAKDKLLDQQIREAEQRGMPFNLKILFVPFTFNCSENRGPNTEISSYLPVPRGVARRHSRPSSSCCCGRDRVGKDHPIATVPPRSRLYQRRPESRLYSTATSRCHVSSGTCRRRDGY